MSTYTGHGAYARTGVAGARVPAKSRSAIVYIGTAPVHTVDGGTKNVNKPVLVSSFAEAKKKFGYDEEWLYTLSEPMHYHMEEMGVGPLVLINVFDPMTDADEEETAELTPAGGRILLADAENVILDTVSIEGVDGGAYFKEYNPEAKTLSLREKKKGTLGTEKKTVKYRKTSGAEGVTTETVIGATDGEGMNTGLYTIMNVYQETGYIPAYLVVPGFSKEKTVHNVMAEVTKKINGHWDAYMMTEMPVTEDVTLSTAGEWKKTNGYTCDNETVSWPCIQGRDGRKHSLPVLRAAALQKILIETDGVPYRTASNTECPIIENLYMGEGNEGRVFTDDLIGEKLNAHGIASAAYVGGRWALWGAHSADYDEETASSVNVAETSRMMLYYISNDFQHRRARNVDEPMTMNDLNRIASEEQARLDALVKIGALTYGKVVFNASEDARSDILMGDFAFSFEITTTPLAKKLTADVYWTDKGFETYIGAFKEVGEAD